MVSNTKVTSILVVSTFLTAPTWAADGTWDDPAGGTWSDAETGNWVSGTVAGGSGFTADFASVDATGSIVVSLGEPRTIGNLVFGDTDTGTVGRWTLNDGGDASNVLTMAGTTPTITNNVTGNDSRVVISTIIGGTDGLATAGPGSFIVLTGANTYSGGTTISSGTLRAQNNSALGTGEVTVADGARLELHSVNLANTINLNGSSALYRTGAGNNDLTGTVNLQSDSQVSMTTSNNGNVIFSGTLNLAANTLTVFTSGSSDIRIDGTIIGGGEVRKANSGDFYITGDNSASYTGTTRLERGTLLVGDDGALGTGTLQFIANNDASAQIRSTDTTTRTIANAMTIGAQSTGNGGAKQIFGSGGTGDLVFTGDVTIHGNRKFQIASTTRFDGLVTGSGGFTLQDSSGTLMLNGTSDYTGDTTVKKGTLLVNGQKTGTGDVDVLLDAVLGGTGSIAGNVTFEDGAIFLAQGAGALNIDGLIDADGGIIATDDILTEASYVVLTHAADALTGTFTVDQSITDLNYQVVYNSDSVVLSQIPEPASLALLGVGGVAMFGRRRRRA